jgi:hypothetical protein
MARPGDILPVEICKAGGKAGFSDAPGINSGLNSPENLSAPEIFHTIRLFIIIYY